MYSIYKIGFSILILISFVMPPFAIAQNKPDSIRIPIDTVYFASYKAVYYRVSVDSNWDEYEWDVFHCDGRLLTSPRYSRIGFYNFSPYPEDERAPYYFKDINADGKGEIIFQLPGGGNSGENEAYIYTLDTIAIEIGRFDGQDISGPSIGDIDGDSINEVVMQDTYFNYWPAGNGANASVSLVWKWDGKYYKLANFKLGKFLVERLYNTPNSFYLVNWAMEDTTKISGFDPGNEDSYPAGLIELMLDLYYAGDSTKAINVFNTVWPDNIPRKKEFYKIFRDKMESSPHWKELQQSNW